MDMSLQEAEELKSVSENGSEVKVEINQDESEIKAEYAVFEEQALLSELQREHEAFAYTAKALGVLLGEIPTPTDIDISQFTKVHDIEMAVVKITREIEAARRVELKLIKDAEKAVAEILEATLSDTGKVQEYKQKVDSVVELLQQLRIGYALPGAHFLNLKKLRTRQGDLMRKQIGLDDDAAFYKEHEKVKNELEYFDGEGMALLRMVTSWKVRRLRERNKELSVIADLYKDLPIPRFKKEIFEKIDALVFKVVRDVSRKITSRFDHEITKITRLDQQKNQPDEKSIEKFNDALIADKFLSVIKDWKKSLDIKRYKSDIEEKQLLRLSDPEYVKKLTDLLKRGFKVRAEGQFGGTTKEKSGIDAEIRQLMRSEEIPYEVEQRMESMLASPIRLPGKAPTQYTPDHRYTDFSDAISLLGPKKKLILVQSQTEFMDNLAKEVCGAVEKRKYEDQRGGNWRDWFDPYDLRALREGVSKGVQSDAQITKSLDGSKEITAIVERFDIERWAAYRGVSEVREKFGDEVIDLVDEVARTKTLNEVYAPEGDVSKRISGASVESLFKYFRDVETMVIAFIASYSNNDIASPGSLIKNTLPYKILASLTEEERAELVEQPIPGIKEFVELMMANPDAPNNEEWTKEDRSKIRNPNYAAMREALVTMCIEFPAKDSRQQDFFIGPFSTSTAI